MKVANASRELEIQTGLVFSIKTPATRKPVESLLPYTLTASCMDHPGIVHKLSRTLSKLGVNIESMETKTYAAPDSGTPIFRLEAWVSVPAGTEVDLLRERFGEIQREENIDIDFSPGHASR
jgi:glycine cleavage system transcriptional repressor